MFYNQTGSDEHVDVNSVKDVIIEDNVFFNDFAGSGRTNPNNTAPNVKRTRRRCPVVLCPVVLAILT